MPTANGTLNDPRIARGMRALLARLRAQVAAGERVIGWKVGFGAPAALARLGLKAPLVGFLTDRARLPSGSALSLAGWKKAAAEPEIAVHFGHDVPGGADRAAIEAAIAGLGPAIEIADVDRAPDDVEAILSGNIYQRHVILGRCDTDRAGGRLDGLVAHVMRNGREMARTSDHEALTGKLLDIVQHVADVLAGCGERLRAGQVVIAGSIVPPVWVEPGEEIAFTLVPVDTVSVRFVRGAAAA